MGTLLTIIAWWFVISIPVSLIAGRLMANVAMTSISVDVLMCDVE